MWKNGDILIDHEQGAYRVGSCVNGYILVVKLQINDNNMKCTVLNESITGYKTGGFSKGMNPSKNIWTNLGKCLLNSYINNIDKTWNKYN